MGKPIAVVTAGVVGEVVVFDTDRGLTGQDGAGFGTGEAAAAAGSHAGDLASRLFTEVPGVRHVFVGSSQVVVRRHGDWDEAALAAATGAIGGHFVFYRG